MKKFLFAFAAGLLILAGCAKEYDDTAIKEKVESLSQKVDKLQAAVDKLTGDVSALAEAIEAAKSGDSISKVEEIKEGGVVTGYTITFVSGKTISLFNGKDGKDGQSPVIGTKEDGGVLYWTVNGEYLISGGKKVPVNVVPSFELKNGHLWVTINGEAQDLGSVTEGASVDGIIKSIVKGETSVIITLNGDPEEVIEIPLAKPFGFEFAETSFAVASTDPIEIAYKINGKTEKTSVGILKAELPAVIDAEKITVTPETATAKGEVVVWASNHEGLSDIVALKFGPAEYDNTDPKPEDPQNIYDDDVDYIAEAKDGAVNIHVTTNVEIAVISDAEWITVGEITKASYTIGLTIEDNPKAEIRYGEVKVVLKNDNTVILQTIKIAQAAGEGETIDDFDPTNFAALDWSNKNAAAWYKFASNYALPDGFTYIIHVYPYNLGVSGMRVGNFGNANESPCNMLRFGQKGDNAELEWMVDTKDGRSEQELLAPGFLVGQWNAIVLTADKTAGEYKIYLNDELKATKSATYNDAMGFGAIEFANSWSSKYRSAFNGRIALLSVYDKALSADEIAANIKCVPTSENCVGFWPMNEGKGGLLKADKSRAIKEDIDLTKVTRSADESNNYEVVDVSDKVTWTTGNSVIVTPTPFDRNVKWTVSSSNKAYEDITVCVTYNEAKYYVPNVKLGTSSVIGSFNVTIPAGTSSVSFYALGWYNADAKLKFTLGETTQEFTAAKNAGVTGNGPFNVTVADTDQYTFTLDAPLAEESNLKIETLTAGKRAVLFGINAAKEEIPVVYTDLSADQANCYIIDVAGAYMIPALKGYSAEPIGTVASAEVLWETYNNAEEVTKGSVIAKAGVKDGSIVFETPATLKPGNALIAAKDADGNILWSWHIWIPATAITSSTYGYIYDHELMDRNLGALVAATTSSVPVESFGLSYQWGRKDPFPGAQDVTSSAQATVSGTVMTVAEDHMTVEETVANPTVYSIYSAADTWGPWLNPKEDTPTLWQDGSKTIYDPCPAGYKVPARNKSMPLHSADLSAVKGWSDNGEAHYFTLGSPVAVFPYSGYITEDGAGMDHAGDRGFIWTSYASSSDLAAYYMNVRSGGDHKLSSTITSRGCSVRCVKIEEAPAPDPEPATNIVLDGNFDDWADGDALVGDQIREWKFSSDAENVYFYMKIKNTDIKASDDGTYKWKRYIYIGLDTDNNEATGDKPSYGGLTIEGCEAGALLYPFRGDTTEGIAFVNGVEEESWIKAPVETNTESQITVWGKTDGEYSYLEMGIPKVGIGSPAAGKMRVQFSFSWNINGPKTIVIQ